MLVAGFAFKMAAVPLHFYAGDVYQGAATPVTAFLSFIPKAMAFVALIKLLYALGGAELAIARAARASQRHRPALLDGGADDDRRERAGTASVQH
jgi:formate hydrogenlyase subunit 3/multisubunit Na+/H+ antiporter MnhD subunit